MKKLRAGDWEVYQLFSDCFHASQLDERRVFSVHLTFTSENEIQAFVQERQLALIGTRTHGTWPTRQYRAKSLAQTIQDAIWDGHIDQMSTHQIAEKYGLSVSIARSILLKIVRCESGDERFKPNAERGEGVIVSDGRTFHYSPMDLNEGAMKRNAPKHYIWFCD